MERTKPEEFARSVQLEFSSKLKEFSYVLSDVIVVDDFVRLRYVSEKNFVEVVLQMPDYEPRVKFGQIGVDDQGNGSPIDIWEVMNLYPDRFPNWVEPKGLLASELKSLANYLVNSCSDFLINDSFQYQRLRKNRILRQSQNEKEQNDKVLRYKASQLWQAGSRGEAAELYKSLAFPTPIEVKRAAFFNMSKLF